MRPESSFGVGCNIHIDYWRNIIYRGGSGSDHRSSGRRILGAIGMARKAGTPVFIS
ncbi:MAG: hypothetical protein JRF22_06120 [Deltaproteobacteria bacterium]|nr:hypothetical protein [Deltaproteobacteria bacterium]